MASTFLGLAIAEIEQQEKDYLYRNDIRAWAKDKLGVTLWRKQVEIAEALIEHKRVAVKSGHGVGKSFLGSVVGAWFNDTRRTLDAVMVSTAPTQPQLDIVWGYMEQHHLKADLFGTITQNHYWKNELGHTRAFGRKPSNTNIHAFQGIHRRNGVLAILDESCHDSETEVLTKEGWKFWADVKDSDEFLTMNPDTEETFYSRAEKIVRKHYIGDMYYYKSRGADFAVTPDHDLLYQQNMRPGRSEYRKVPIKDMVWNNRYGKKSITWEGVDAPEFVLPAYSSERKSFPEMRFKSEDWAQFLGWFGSEGSIAKDGYSVQIAQKQEHYRDEIRGLLSRMGFSSTAETSNGFSVFGGQLAHHLSQFGRTCDVKRLPPYVLGWSPRLLNIFLDAYVSGDGSRYSGNDVIYTSCTDMADDLHEVVLKSGVPGTLSVRNLKGIPSTPLSDGRRITSTRDGYVITRPHRDTTLKYLKSNLEVRHYDGMVYCATIPNTHTLFTRRGGKTLWSGNCGIPESIFTAVDAITTGRHDYVLAIGNPDDINTPFGQIWTNANVGASWHKMTISSYDSPNLTGEDFPQEAKDGLVTAEWIEQRRVAWGEDSPRFLSKVLGEFSDSAANTLFTMADLLKGHTAEVEPNGEDRPVLGVDVARYGADESVVYVNHNGHIRLEDSWGKTDLVTTAEKVNEIALQTGAKEVRVDGVGVGAGVVDILRSINMDQYKVISLIGNAGSPDLSKWINARAYWYDTVRERMHKGEIDIDITDSKLSDELGDIQYHFKNNRSVLQVEKKEEIRERKKKMMSGNVDETGGSPDHADAFIYAAVDHGLDVNNPLSQLQPGDILELDVGAFLFEDEMSFGDF